MTQSESSISHESLHFTHQYPDWLLRAMMAAALHWMILWGTYELTPLTCEKHLYLPEEENVHQGGANKREMMHKLYVCTYTNQPQH